VEPVTFTNLSGVSCPICLLLFAGAEWTGALCSTFNRASAGSISGARTLFLLDTRCEDFGADIRVGPEGADAVDGVFGDGVEFTGAAPLGPSAGTIDVEGTSSSPIPAAKAGADKASVATATTRASPRAERKSR
jgi:hypothetical protein